MAPPKQGLPPKPTPSSVQSNRLPPKMNNMKPPTRKMPPKKPKKVAPPPSKSMLRTFDYDLGALQEVTEFLEKCPDFIDDIANSSGEA